MRHISRGLACGSSAGPQKAQSGCLPRIVGHSSLRKSVNAYPSLRPALRRCCRCHCHDHDRGPGSVRPRNRGRFRHSIPGTGGRLLRQPVATVRARLCRARRRRRLRHDAGEEARRLGSDVARPALYGGRTVPGDVRVDRLQHLSVRDRRQCPAGSPGGNVDDADADRRRQGARSVAEGGQLPRTADEPARHLDGRPGEIAGGQGPRRAQGHVPARHPRDRGDRDGHHAGRQDRPLSGREKPRHRLRGQDRDPYCHNGNRGYETCAALAAMGIDCRFLVGGLEKWLVEKRPLTGLRARTLDDLRALSAYPNQATLLDTPQVRDLVKSESVVFVDPRYPGEFASGHLPNAINLPVRPTPTEQLKDKLSSLPKKPIVVPCYDRRSCFFGEVLGLELSRRGYDYRGRYTTPWEYFVKGEPRPYIKEWLAEAHKGYFQKAAEWLAGVLSLVAAGIGLLLTIALLAGLSRLFILPFAVKAERDQIKAREASAEMDDIKVRFKDNPAGKSRAIRAFSQRHGMTPRRNLIAMGFLPIMAVALLAVQDLAGSVHGSLPWIDNLAGRDPWLILPLVFGVLITIYLDLAFATSATKRIAIWLIGLPALTATGAVLAASADVYLITSATLLVIQRLYVSGIATRLWQGLRRGRTPAGILALDDVAKLENCGNKAYRLARMRAAGMPVPDGIVLTPDFMTRIAAVSAATRHHELGWIWRRLGNVKLAVRSSGSGEDG